MAQHTHEETKYGRSVATLALEAALKKKNYQKAADLIEIAESYGVKKTLRFKAWNALGAHWMGKGQFADAVIAINSARHIKPFDMGAVKLLVTSLKGFVNEYKDVFSVSDLAKIDYELERILEYYKVNRLWDHPAIKQGKDLRRGVGELKRSAKEAIETPATHKTDRIVDALHTNVTLDEVRADFARLITPYVLEQLAEEEKKASKKKKGKKAAKNKDLEKEETEE